MKWRKTAPEAAGRCDRLVNDDCIVRQQRTDRLR
jgi:hypothetical protein